MEEWCTEFEGKETDFVVSYREQRSALFPRK